MARDISHTLIETLTVIIIIGILVLLALSRYGSIKEDTFNKEARANLKLIMAAEKIYRMDTQYYSYYDSGSVQPAAVNNVNTYLRLLLSNASNRAWDYITKADNGVSPATCCVQATRNGTGARTWSMNNSQDEPVENGACP